MSQTILVIINPIILLCNLTIWKYSSTIKLNLDTKHTNVHSPIINWNAINFHYRNSIEKQLACFFFPVNFIKYMFCSKIHVCGHIWSWIYLILWKWNGSSYIEDLTQKENQQSCTIYSPFIPITSILFYHSSIVEHIMKSYVQWLSKWFIPPLNRKTLFKCLWDWRL